MLALFFNETVANCVALITGGAFASAVGVIFTDAVKLAGVPVDTAVFDPADSGLVNGNTVSADLTRNGRAVFIQFRSDLVQWFFEFKTGGYFNPVGKGQMF